MQSPYESSGPKKIQRPRMTSNDLQSPEKIEPIKPVSNVDTVLALSTIRRSKLIAGSMHEYKDEGLVDTLQNNNNIWECKSALSL